MDALLPIRSCYNGIALSTVSIIAILFKVMIFQDHFAHRQYACKNKQVKS